MGILYKVENFEKTYSFLEKLPDKEKVILTNSVSALKSYGIITINYIFSELKRIFDKKIIAIEVNIADDHAAFWTILRYKYQYINYIGKSEEIKRIIKILNIQNIPNLSRNAFS